MSRLIDADKIDFNEAFVGASEFAQDTRNAAQMLIDNQPTAFDVDEVVQQLETLIEDKCSESGDDWYTAQCLNEAVEIVKSGGIK
mgnify:FL=1